MKGRNIIVGAIISIISLIGLLCGFTLAYIGSFPAYMLILMSLFGYALPWGISKIREGWKEFQEATDKEQLPLRLLGTMGLILSGAFGGILLTVMFVLEVMPWPGIPTFLGQLFWYLITMTIIVGGSGAAGAQYDAFVEDAEEQDKQKKEEKLELKPLSLNLDSITKIESKININESD